MSKHPFTRLPTEGDDNIVAPQIGSLIAGYDGNDTLQGGAGNDFFFEGVARWIWDKAGPFSAGKIYDFGRGDDWIYGGEGTDAISWFGSSDRVVLDHSAGTAERHDQIDHFQSVEIFTLTDNDDVVVSMGEAGTFYGEGGFDTLDLRDFTAAGSLTISPGVVQSYQHVGANTYETVRVHFDGFEAILGATDATNTISVDIRGALLVGGRLDDLIENKGATSALYGEGGDDTLTAAGGTLSLYGGDGDDLIGNAGGDNALKKIWGAAGNDTIMSNGGRLQVYGGDGEDAISATGGDGLAKRLYGGDGDDTIDADLGRRQLYGDGGNDLLRLAEWGTETITANGGTGYDLVVLPSAAPAGASLVLDAGSVSLDTGVRLVLRDVEALRLSDASESLDGVLWRFDLDLAGGDDLIARVNNGHSYQGGAGDDTLDLSAKSARIDLDLNTGTLAFGATRVELLGFEIAYGSATRSNNLVGDENDNAFYGGAQDDTLSGGGGADLLVGGDGDDTIIDIANPKGKWPTALDRIFGGSGNDTVYAGLAYVEGGAGDDVIRTTDRSAGIALRTEVYGGDGNDRITGQAFFGYGGEGSDTFAGGVLGAYGGEGNDRFVNTSGRMDGGDGDDVFIADGGEIYGGDGYDVAYMGSGTFSLTGHGDQFFDGIEKLVMDDRDRSIIILNGGTTVALGAGSESITCFRSNVTIDSGPGDDRFALLGSGLDIDSGEGNDTFYFNRDADKNIAKLSHIDTGLGEDTVTLNGGSMLRLDTGDGDDSVTKTSQSAFTRDVVITTGNGNDYVDLKSAAGVTLDTGDGDDRVWCAPDAVAIRLGDGNDTLSTFSYYTNRGGQPIDAGAGDDLVHSGAAIDRLHLGSGADRLELQYVSGGTVWTDAGADEIYWLAQARHAPRTAHLTIADFDVGEDRFGVAGASGFSDALSLEQSGNSVIATFDIGDGRTAAFTFRGLSLDQMTDTLWLEG